MYLAVKRPACSNALSKTSTRLVAAKMITPLLSRNRPSRSVTGSMCSRSSLPPIAAALDAHVLQRQHLVDEHDTGAFSFAWRNKSRTRSSTNISTKSEPAKEKKGTLASPATAFASRVFPVPEGLPARRPWASYLPNRYISGALSRINNFLSCLALSKSCHIFECNLMGNLSSSWALDFPTLKMPPPPPMPPPTAHAAGHEKSRNR